MILPIVILALKVETMEAKVLELKSNKKTNKQLSIEDYKKFLGNESKDYSNEELLEIKDYLFLIARMYYDFYKRTFGKESKIIQLNKESDDTQKSITVRKGEYRRAS